MQIIQSFMKEMNLKFITLEDGLKLWKEYLEKI